MATNIHGSVVADNQSSVNNSSNSQTINTKKIYGTAAIISLVVGTLSSLAASYLWDMLKK